MDHRPRPHWSRRRLAAGGFRGLFWFDTCWTLALALAIRLSTPGRRTVAYAGIETQGTASSRSSSAR